MAWGRAKDRARAGGSAQAGGAPSPSSAKGTEARGRWPRERDAEPPDVGGRPDLGRTFGQALLGRHVRIRSDRGRMAGILVERHRHAQVDQQARAVMMMFRGLTSRWTTRRSASVVERRAELERERKQLLEDEAVAPVQGRRRGPSRYSSTRCGRRRRRARSEAADDDRVVGRGQQRPRGQALGQRPGSTSRGRSTLATARAWSSSSQAGRPRSGGRRRGARRRGDRGRSRRPRRSPS